MSLSIERELTFSATILPRSELEETSCSISKAIRDRVQAIHPSTIRTINISTSPSLGSASAPRSHLWSDPRQTRRETTSPGRRAWRGEAKEERSHCPGPRGGNCGGRTGIPACDNKCQGGCQGETAGSSTRRRHLWQAPCRYHSHRHDGSAERRGRRRLVVKEQTAKGPAADFGQQGCEFLPVQTPTEVS